MENSLRACGFEGLACKSGGVAVTKSLSRRTKLAGGAMPSRGSDLPKLDRQRLQ